MNLEDLLDILDREESEGHWLLGRLGEFDSEFPISLVGVLNEEFRWVSVYSAPNATLLLPKQVREYLKSAPITEGDLVRPLAPTDLTLFATPIECRCIRPRTCIPTPMRGTAVTVLAADTARVAARSAHLRSALQAAGCSALLAGLVEQYAVWVEQLRNERSSLQQAQMKAVEQALEEHEKVLLAEESHRALRELMEARDAARRSKDLFFANLSHELRTPLHGILSYAAFGIKKAETAERSTLLKYFTQIERSGQTLLAFLNDLLDLAKLEAGKMQYDFAWHDPAQLMARVLDEFSSACEHRRIHFEFVPPPEPIKAWMDDQRIQQVFRNLVSNAIKFSPQEGAIQVTISAAEGRCLVAVADRGCGVPPNEIESIFDPFVQSSKTRTASGGTGLGLAICREIVHSHGGRIWAENRPDGGACFRVQLPIHPPESSSRVEQTGVGQVLSCPATEPAPLSQTTAKNG